MTNKSVMLDLDDPKTGKIAEVIGNKTAKRILGVIAEKEMSESEIAKELGVALNTVGYNIKKLKGAGLIEPVKGFLWSVKGKRIQKYKVTNKRIVISPRVGVGGILPALAVSVLGALGLKMFYDSKFEEVSIINTGLDSGSKVSMVAESSGAASVNGISAVQSKANSVLINMPDVWVWFLLGALTVLLVLIVWNWRKER
jgi:DNA-binding transcriptional ArsR family regulator